MRTSKPFTNTLNRLTSVFLVLCLLITAFPITAFADDDDHLVVTRDHAPIRRGNNEDASVVAYCNKGDILETTGSSLNHWLNRWYKVRYNGDIYYIYSGNVRTSSHSYTRFTYEGVKYAVCTECGHANVTLTVSTKVSNSTAFSVASYLPVGLGYAAVDGPLPFGDLAFLLTIALTTYAASSSLNESVVMDLTMDLVDFLNDNDYERVCSIDSFYQVLRVPNGLKKLSNTCYNYAEAYAYVLAGGDVWTETFDAAQKLAFFYPDGGYPEIDDDSPGYYYHFHFGRDVKHKNRKAGHIFYGTSYIYGTRPQ